MSQVDLLRFVADLFEKLQIEWMLVGSHASSFYGEPRSTNDIDLVVDIPEQKFADLLAAIPSDRYYLSEAALREGRMANLIDTTDKTYRSMRSLHDRIHLTVRVLHQDYE